MPLSFFRRRVEESRNRSKVKGGFTTAVSKPAFFIPEEDMEHMGYDVSQTARVDEDLKQQLESRTGISILSEGDLKAASAHAYNKMISDIEAASGSVDIPTPIPEVVTPPKTITELQTELQQEDSLASKFKLDSLCGQSCEIAQSQRTNVQKQVAEQKHLDLFSSIWSSNRLDYLECLLKCSQSLGNLSSLDLAGKTLEVVGAGDMAKATTIFNNASDISYLPDKALAVKNILTSPTNQATSVAMNLAGINSANILPINTVTDKITGFKDHNVIGVDTVKNMVKTPVGLDTAKTIVGDSSTYVATQLTAPAPSVNLTTSLLTKAVRYVGDQI